MAECRMGVKGIIKALSHIHLAAPDPRKHPGVIVRCQNEGFKPSLKIKNRFTLNFLLPTVALFGNK